MDGLSLNLTDERIFQLQSLFPDVFSEGRIDFDRLKASLGEHLANPRDHYELTWAGKAEARKEVQKQTSATLLPDLKSSVDFDTSENLFIEGENLEVLRVLQKSYFGKVKMIYIDPPYNTGNDSFVYPDDYSERKEEYERRTGIKDEAGYLNKQDLWKKNSKESGQFHSVWLSMMYPRLYLSRNLLCEDGIIFVSIDDNEQGNLKMLMDEIFGEENFIASIIWQKKYAPKSDSKYLSESHDYILFYAKNTDLFIINHLPKTDKQNDRYVNKDGDERGPWKPDNVLRSEFREYAYFPVTLPSGRQVYPPSGTSWRYTKEKFDELIADNRIWFGEDGDKRPAYKRFLSEVRDTIPSTTLWTYDEVGHNDAAKKEIRAVLGEDVFSTPKPSTLISRMIQISTQQDSIILDFFAGSGTTAQAVLDLNAEDGGNRKFILVQLPEETDEESEAYKAGYNTIADISKARIQKIIKKIKEKQAQELTFSEKKQDLGFKAYRLAPSNFKVWRQDIQGAEAVANQLEMFKSPYQEGSDEENMLYELILKSGLPLTTAIEEKEAGGVKYYVLNKDRVFALYGVNKALLEAVEALQPLVFITLDKFFANQDQLMSNTQLQLEEAGVEFRVI